MPLTTCSNGFVDWLREQQLSLACTTYESNNVILVGLRPNGSLSILERELNSCMGVCATRNGLYVSTLHHVWRFENSLRPGQISNGYDRLYIPQVGNVTGDLGIRDLVLGEDGVVFASTELNCLGTLSQTRSFQPIWKPRFIDALVAEDRCHLNGVALYEGRPRWVTLVAETNTEDGWREHRRDGGCVIDTETDETVLRGLSMPHSPRYHGKRLWLLNSGTGELGYAELNSGSFEAVRFCPGFLRGLDFHGRLAIVGLSKPRQNAFTGLALDDSLEARGQEPRCGIEVIDLDSGRSLHWLTFDDLKELYDIAVLPGVRCPALRNKIDPRPLDDLTLCT